jgi:hypothetical protein
MCGRLTAILGGRGSAPIQVRGAIAAAAGRCRDLRRSVRGLEFAVACPAADEVP